MERSGKCFALAIALLVSSACDPPTSSTKVPPPHTNPVTATITGTVSTVTNQPIAGAIVKVESGAVARTDGAGRFQATFQIPASPTAISAEGTGYHPSSQVFTLSANTTVVVDFALEALEKLTIGSSVTGTISGNDPPTYVGMAYDSDYSRHTKYYTYTTPVSDDLIVELSWTPTANAALVMWTQEGDIKSIAAGDRQQIRLPHDTSGNLLVGQPWEAGALSVVVPFTLDARGVGTGAASVRRK